MGYLFLETSVFESAARSGESSTASTPSARREEDVVAGTALHPVISGVHATDVRRTR